MQKATYTPTPAVKARRRARRRRLEAMNTKQQHGPVASEANSN